MLYLPLTIDIASINSFEVQVFRHICMDKHTNKSSICHDKLARMIISQDIKN